MKSKKFILPILFLVCGVCCGSFHFAMAEPPAVAPFVSIPPELGVLDAFYEGPNGRLVIYVEDIYENYAAQKNIALMLEYVASKNGVTRVMLEGAIGAINVDLFKTFPIPGITRHVLDRYMQEGRVGGPEFAATVSEQGLSLEGLDEYGSHNRSLARLAAILDHRAEGLKQMSNFLKEESSRADESEVAKDFNRYLELIENGLNLRLTRTELRTLSSLREKFASDSNANAPEDGITQSALSDLVSSRDLDSINSHADRVKAFYRDAFTRDARLAERLVAELRASGENALVVVMGRFHRDGVTSYLKEKGYSYAVLVPNKGNDSDLNTQLDTVGGRYETDLLSGRNTLAPAIEIANYLTFKDRIAERFNELINSPEKFPDEMNAHGFHSTADVAKAYAASGSFLTFKSGEQTMVVPEFALKQYVFQPMLEEEWATVSDSSRTEYVNRLAGKLSEIAFIEKQHFPSPGFSIKKTTRSRALNFSLKPMPPFFCGAVGLGQLFSQRFTFFRSVHGINWTRESNSVLRNEETLLPARYLKNMPNDVRAAAEDKTVRSMIYERSGVDIFLLDGFPGDNRRLELSEVELKLVQQTLDQLPLDHLRNVHWIVTRSANRRIHYAGEVHEGGFSIFLKDNYLAAAETPRLLQGTSLSREDVHQHPNSEFHLHTLGSLDDLVKTVVHETGHQIYDYKPVVKGFNLRKWWAEVHFQAAGEKQDYATAYARTDDREDWAETYMEWVVDTDALWQRALERADDGDTVLLEKVLLVAAHFISNSGGVNHIRFYQLDRDTDRSAEKIPNLLFSEQILEWSPSNSELKLGPLKLFFNAEGLLKEIQYKQSVHRMAKVFATPITDMAHESFPELMRDSPHVASLQTEANKTEKRNGITTYNLPAKQMMSLLSGQADQMLERSIQDWLNVNGTRSFHVLIFSEVDVFRELAKELKRRPELKQALSSVSKVVWQDIDAASAAEKSEIRAASEQLWGQGVLLSSGLSELFAADNTRSVIFPFLPRVDRDTAPSAAAQAAVPIPDEVVRTSSELFRMFKIASRVRALV